MLGRDLDMDTNRVRDGSTETAASPELFRRASRESRHMIANVASLAALHEQP